jgi:hypothetical protein
LAIGGNCGSRRHHKRARRRVASFGPLTLATPVWMPAAHPTR